MSQLPYFIIFFLYAMIETMNMLYVVERLS